jgi:hypothetical protein
MRNERLETGNWNRFSWLTMPLNFETQRRPA